MEEKEFDSMNILPLVDVMLVLLTIVLTTATFVAKGLIPVELPTIEKSGSKAHAKNQNTVVEISREGQIYVNAVQHELENLVPQLQALPKESDIVIRADKRIQLDLFLQVLSRLKKHGFSNISVQTEEKG
ncbi:MAG: biopolymer transporter ExbD [Turneriella sp.]